MSSSSSSSSCPTYGFDPNIAVYVGGGEPPEDYFVEALVKYRAANANGVVLRALDNTPTNAVIGVLRNDKAEIWWKHGVCWHLLATSGALGLVDGVPYKVVLVKEGSDYSLWAGSTTVTLRATTKPAESSLSSSSESSESSSSRSSELSSSSSPLPSGPFYPGIYVESHLPTIDCFCAGDLHYMHIAGGALTTDCPVCSFTS